MGFLKKSQKIVIYRTSSIGDVVLSSCCLSLLGSLDLLDNVIWMGREPTLSLLKAAYPEIEVRDMDKLAKTDGIQPNEQPVLIVDLQTNLRSILFTWRISRFYSCARVQAQKKGSYRFLKILLARLRGRRLPRSKQLNQNIYQYELLKRSIEDGLKKINADKVFFQKLGNAVAHSKPDLWRDNGLELLARSDNFVAFGQSVPKEGFVQADSNTVWFALAPGAAHATKKTPLELWIKLLHQFSHYLLRQEKSLGIVILGTKSEANLGTQIDHACSKFSKVLNLAGTKSLIECALILKKTSGLLSNDSALAHIGESVGIPVGVFFGPTVEDFGFAPWRNRSRSFSSPLGCRPCSKHGKNPCRYKDLQCFWAIDLGDCMEFLISCIRNPVNN